MPQKIIIPNWEILSLEEKEHVIEHIKLIMSARKSAANLLKLISRSDDPEIMTTLDTILKEPDELEVITDASINLESFKRNKEDIASFCEIICKIISLGNGKTEEKCSEICNQS
ncbi:hypothetical protein [Anabaena sp. CCY 9910]|uniref:hypothetical protein n=1 Tax=Anabaena sp. CCY 9910 TaxID=3103870 RepID=UPI0039E0615F